MKKQRLFSLCNVFLCLLRCQNRFVRLFVHKAYLPNIPKGCLPFFQMPALEHQSLGRCLHQNRLDRTGLFGQYNGCCFLKRSWQYQSDNRFLRHIHSQSNSLLYHCKEYFLAQSRYGIVCLVYILFLMLLKSFLHLEKIRYIL